MVTTKKYIYSEIISRSTHSQRFTHHPWQICSLRYQLKWSGNYSHAVVTARRLFAHIYNVIPATFIYTADWTGASWGDENAQASKRQQRGFKSGLPRFRIRYILPRHTCRYKFRCANSRLTRCERKSKKRGTKTEVEICYTHKIKWNEEAQSHAISTWKKIRDAPPPNTVSKIPLKKKTYNLYYNSP